VECTGTSITGEIEIAASPEAVFDALVTPGDLAAWWGSPELYTTHDWKIDLRPGGEYSCQATAAAGHLSTVRGTYLEVDRPRTLAYTWIPSWEDRLPATTVRFTLIPIASGTRVEILHEGFAGFPQSQSGHSEGWKRVLGWLAAYCAAKGDGMNV
jgi:uncharacterized protein YndB with AHSA1/START domain